jgi:hypothetical protein
VLVYYFHCPEDVGPGAVIGITKRCAGEPTGAKPLRGPDLASFNIETRRHREIGFGATSSVGLSQDLISPCGSVARKS